MYAIIVEGRVVALTEDMPPAGSMYMETFDWDVRPGWLLSGGALVAPAERVDPTPGPVPVAHSYMLADAQSVDDLREALAVILGL